jgi:hypothetical protein
MFELETIMKTYADADDDFDVPLTAGEAREIIDEFSRLKTAMRRIRSVLEPADNAANVSTVGIAREIARAHS